MADERYILLNIAYGTGPYLRTTELAFALDDHLHVIVPLLYGDKQRQIMREVFGEAMERIVLDEEYGALLQTLHYRNERYADFLQRWVDTVDETGARIGQYLGDTYGDAIALQLARAPFSSISSAPAYYTSFAFLSDIWSEAIGREEIAIEDALLTTAAEKMRTMEVRYEQHFITEPGTFSYAPKEHNQMLIPPTLHPPSVYDGEVEPGIYVTVTGVPGLHRLFSDVQKWGMKIYTNTPEAIPGSTKALPSVIGHPNIKAHFSRSSWSSIWTSLFTGTPFIAAPYDQYDDPEIFFNNECITKLNLGIVYAGQPLDDLLEEAHVHTRQLEETKQSLKERFGTLDGITYTAEKIVADLLQKGIRLG